MRAISAASTALLSSSAVLNDIVQNFNRIEVSGPSSRADRDRSHRPAGRRQPPLPLLLRHTMLPETQCGVQRPQRTSAFSACQ